MMVTSVSKISLRVTGAYVLLPSAVTLSIQDGGINVQTAYQFTVQTPLPGPVGLKIQIKIPSQLGILSLTDSSTVILTSAAGFAPVAEIPHLQILNEDDQSVELSLLVPNQNYYVDEGNFIRFDLFDIVNAPSILPSDSFELTFYEFDDIIMSITQGISTTADPGQLSSMTVEPEGYRVREQVPYTFSFVTANRVFTDGQISIIVPENIHVIEGELTFTSIQTVTEDGTASIQYDSDSHTISILNAFQSDYTTPQLVEFTINTGLKNADSTKPTDQFVIRTLDSSGAIIDEGTSVQLTFTPNEISSIVTTACSDKQTASETLDVCTYKLQFVIGADYPVIAGSTIEIDLPDDLSLFLVSGTESLSKTTGIADLSSKFQVTNSGRTVTVLNAFNPLSAPNGIDYRQDSFAVEIAGIISPRTTAPTLSFKARIRSSDGYLQYTRLQGVYSNVFQARSFNKVVVTRTNETNGDDSGRYNFTLEFSSTVFKNEYIKITPPEDVVINPGGSGQCQGTRLLSTTLACSILDGSLYVLIDPLSATTSQFNAGNIVQFQVSDIRNPLSLEPTESFDIFVATSTSQNYYVNQMVQGLSVLNSYYGQLTDVRMLPDTNQFSAVTDYSIYFVTTNVMDTFSYIIIQFPAGFYSFQGNNQPCTAIKNIQGSLICTPSNGNTLTITRGYITGALPAGSEVGIKLNSVTNPSGSVSKAVINEQFFIETLTVDNYGIDRSYNLDFSIGCSYPCQSCNSSQTLCTSCQMLNAQTFLYLYNTQCNIECPVGTYADQLLACKDCDPLCKRCSKSPSVCDSCRDDLGYPYVTSQGTCTAKCTDGTYLSEADKSCQDCEGNCNTCSSAIECLSCDLGYYFIEGQCLDTCPSNSIQFDSVEVQECLQCQDPCASCVDTIDKCTSCSPSTFLFENQCIDKCPATYLPDATNACYKASEQTYPFISLSLTGLVLLILLISWLMNKQETNKQSIWLGLESCVMIFFWIYMLAFFIRDGHQASATLVSLALFANFVINYLWWEFYNDKLYKNDVQFQQYDKMFPKTTKMIKIMSLLVCSDFFRISYSHLWGLDQLKADMLKKDKCYKRINRYSLFSITFVYLPALVAAAYNLFYTWWGRQIFWIDIECLAVGSIMLIFKLYVIFQSEKGYIQQVLHLDNKAKQQKVMSAGVDDDDFQENDPDAQALRVAQQINQKGVDTTRFQIRELTNEQRVIAVKAVFHKLITGKTTDEFLLHHGGPNQYKTQQPQQQLLQRTYDEVPNDTLGQTQNLNQETNDEFQFNENGPMQTQLVNQTDRCDQEVEEKRMYSDISNFQSAPLNAQSALQGNKDLEARHLKFQEELKNRKNKQLKKKNLRDLDFDDDVRQSAFNKTLASKVLGDMPHDSDDQIENFTSEQWGPGASKVVAEHFNTIQARNKLNSPTKDKKEWAANGDKSTIPSQIQSTKLTQEQFTEKIEEVRTQQVAKRLAKEKAFEFAESSQKLDTQLKSQQVENKKLRDFIKALELQIASEQGRLNGVRQTKKEEIEFAENAFYTSNEDGMGVSPNNFVSQNRMPVKPSAKPKDQADREEQPINQVDPKQLILENEILKGSVKSNHNTSGRADLEVSRISKSAGKSISASEIKAIQVAKGSRRSEFESDSDTLVKRVLLMESSDARLIPTSSGDLKKIPQETSGSRRKKSVGRSKRRNSLSNIVNSSGNETLKKRTKSNSHKNKVMATEGKATRKPHQKSLSRSGLKSTGRDSFNKRELKHRPLNNESEKYEYYTSEDEFGLPVNKLRKKGSKSRSRSNRKGSKSNRNSKSKPRQTSTDEDLEFYSTVDNKGNRVQKLRLKKAKSHTGRRVAKVMAGEESKSQFNFRPEFQHLEQSTIKGSVMGQTNDNFARFSAISSRGNLTSARDVPQTGRSRAQGQFTQRQVAGTDVHSQMTTYRAATQERKHQQSQALRNAGITVVKTSNEKSKSRKKKVSAPQRDFSGPYFNHTNFEKAVIATNGRAPFNNKEVEVITKQREFNPNEFQFRNKNNWINQTINETKMAPLSQNSPRVKRQRQNQGNDMASASVTATTVFQGLNQSGLLGSVQNTEAKPPHLSQTQQQFGFGGSPVTLRGRQNDVGGVTEITESPQNNVGMTSPENKPIGNNLLFDQSQSYLQRMPSRE